MIHVFPATRSRIGTLSPTAAPKKHAEQVFRIAPATAGAFFQSLETVLVVLGTIFLVAQNFVRGIDFFERVLVAALIGVVLSIQACNN